MLPIGRVHLTSGVLPRKDLALSDDWVTPGLRRLIPSVRVGPVLVDPAEIRFPLVDAARRQADLHPAHRPADLAGRPHPRRHPDGVPAAAAARGAGGLDPGDAGSSRPDGSPT